MHFIVHGLFVVLLIISGDAFAFDAAAPIDNAQLKAMHDADQGERQAMFQAPQPERAAAQKKIYERDVERLAQAKQMLRESKIRTAADYWRAAFILQHGDSIDDIRLAFSLGTIAKFLAPEKKAYGWITAASWDRILTRNQQPQWYGTQFDNDPVTGKQVQIRIAEGAVTDAEREALGVPTLEESQEMLLQINAAKSP